MLNQLPYIIVLLQNKPLHLDKQNIAKWRIRYGNC